MSQPPHNGGKPAAPPPPPSDTAQDAASRPTVKLPTIAPVAPVAPPVAPGARPTTRTAAVVPPPVPGGSPPSVPGLRPPPPPGTGTPAGMRPTLGGVPSVPPAPPVARPSGVSPRPPPPPLPSIAPLVPSVPSVPSLPAVPAVAPRVPPAVPGAGSRPTVSLQPVAPPAVPGSGSRPTVSLQPVAPPPPPAAATAPPPPPPPPRSAEMDPAQVAALAERCARLDQMDYFEILMVDRAVAPADIKKAFYRESRAYHPDRFFHLSDKELKERVNELYKRVTEAYYVLRDDAKRRQYGADISGPERAQKLRFTESSEAETRAASKRQVEEQIGVHPKGRQFYQTGVTDADAGRWASAERNLKMALTYEPANARYKEKLAEVQKVLLEESRKQGDAFKIR
jgi:DnaJ-domain-containing protein 1